MTTPGANQWPTNLTACCASPGGLPRFCLACWCPCVSYSELLKEPELKGYCCYGDRISACVSYALLQTLGIFPAAALHAGARSTLRGERNYSGSLGEDFCATACCSTCALVQELNAADLRQQQQQQQAATVDPHSSIAMSDDEDVKSLDTRAPVEHDDDVDDDAKTNKKPAADCDGAVTIKKKTNTAGRRKQVNPKKHNKPKLSAAAADGTKRKRHYKPGTVALRQIRKYQKSAENLLPRATFKRLVKEITAEMTAGNDFFEGGVRFKSDAVDALQVAAESEIVTLFNVANSLSIDIGKSVTVGIDSLRVAFNLRNADHRINGGLAGPWNSRHGSILP